MATLQNMYAKFNNFIMRKQIKSEILHTSQTLRRRWKCHLQFRKLKQINVHINTYLCSLTLLHWPLSLDIRKFSCCGVWGSSRLLPKHHRIGYSSCEGVCSSVQYPAMDWHSIRGVFPPCTQCFWDGFQIHSDPNLDKVLPEGEWMSDASVCCVYRWSCTRLGFSCLVWEWTLISTFAKWYHVDSWGLSFCNEQ